MGSFEDHMRYGVVAYAVAVVLSVAGVGYLVYAGRAEVQHAALVGGAAVAGFPFAVAGAGFPDIDHHAAKPHRYFKKWVSVIAAVVGGYVLFTSGVAAEAGTAAMDGVATASVAPEPVVGGGMAAVGGVVSGIVAYLGVGLLKPPHRGVTHTLGAGIVVAGVVGVGVGYAGGVIVPLIVPSSAFTVGAIAGGIAGGSFFIGFLSHLQCDGLLVGVLPDAM
jgi:hypothetical protein